jgi:hypothetical protein
MSALIKFGRRYESLLDFLRDVFYRNESLAEPALSLIKRIYSTKFGLSIKRWDAYISEIFGCDKLDDEEEKMLSDIEIKFSNLIKKGRGNKPYFKLLKMSESGKISLSTDEIEVLKKAVEWNSSVSKYYVILNKLLAIGLVRKEKGSIVQNKEFINWLDIIKKQISSLNEEKDYIVYEGKQ